MDSCCQTKGAELSRLKEKQSRTLWIVLFVNAAMFGAELIAGLIAGSIALQADSLDMLGDALVYAFSLYVVSKSIKWRAAAAILKGGVMAVFGLLVLTQSIYKIVNGTVPEAEIIGIVALIALAANGFCLVLLTRHRADDVNMRSTWLCSRNDIIANVGVIVAAGLVAATSSIWPDFAVGFFITVLFLKTSYIVLREGWNEFRTGEPSSATSMAEICDSQT